MLSRTASGAYETPVTPVHLPAKSKNKSGSHGEIRTLILSVLSGAPLPIGLHGLERDTGNDPVPTGWKPVVLPLY